MPGVMCWQISRRVTLGTVRDGYGEIQYVALIECYCILDTLHILK